MTAILSKPIDQLTPDDIASLVTSRVPEGERMEFKRELPAQGTERSGARRHGEEFLGYWRRGGNRWRTAARTSVDSPKITVTASPPSAR